MDSLLAIRIIILSFFILDSFAELQSFGITVQSHNGTTTNETVTMTLWFNSKIYECDIKPGVYECNATSWNVIGEQCFNDDIEPEFKVLFNNRDQYPLVIDNVFVNETNGIQYKMDKFCLWSDAVPSGTNPWQEAGGDAGI